ncbi:MAG: RIP metalloprotease RseP [Thiofilum sp.]|uniref:RIP metalloprotease RseP n=1 Tax=Thiofilum sp. TaxID=2212733 RepID=UPI002600A249|nr:RIP metalloprotease RseP [Thiofilum sp.]MBK8453589.1 RIP metalloprotease RseP [Thiofilum sp.]
MDLLIIIPAFLVTIGILVTIHEFGHYWVARKLGVKVLRFSVGMGKPFWSKRGKDADQVEYALAPFPIGGYVQMLDEREGTVDPSEVHRAFNRQPVWKRFAIVAAGPIANFLLAIFLYALMFGIGVPAYPPLVTALPNTPAAEAGIQAGDKIVAVAGHPVVSFQDARQMILEQYLVDPIVSLEVETQQGQPATRTMDLTDIAMLADERDYLQKAGLRNWAPQLAVYAAGVRPNSPAEAAGVKPSDKIVAINAVPIQTSDDVMRLVRQSEGKALILKLERANEVLSLSVTPQWQEVNGQQALIMGISLTERSPPEVIQQLQFTQRYGLVDALVRGIEETRQITVMSVKLMGRLVTGEVSLKNISGPVTIAQFSGEAAKSGLTYFIGFLAIISVSLGILNLLPIPMLDGGHLLFYIVEMIKGSPVSQRVEELGMRVGLTAIGSLMVLALYNDLMRLIR